MPEHLSLFVDYLLSSPITLQFENKVGPSVKVLWFDDVEVCPYIIGVFQVLEHIPPGKDDYWKALKFWLIAQPLNEVDPVKPWKFQIEESHCGRRHVAAQDFITKIRVSCFTVGQDD